MLYSYIRIEDIKKILKNSFKHLKEGSEVKYLNKKNGSYKNEKMDFINNYLYFFRCLYSK